MARVRTIVSLITPVVFAATAARAAAITSPTVSQWCAKARPGSVVKTMLTDVIPKPDVRMAFVRHVTSSRQDACTAGLKSYFDELAQKKDLTEAKKQEGVKALLVIGLAAQMPGAVRVVEREILAGESDEWLPTLEQANRELFVKTLRQWADATAADARAQDDLSQMKPIDPIMVDRYIRLFQNPLTTPTATDLKNINVLFAASAGGSRDAFMPTLRPLLRKRDAVWLPTVRSEPAWVQMRLMPLMVQVAGPEVMRELMWMSEASADSRVRASANRSIDLLVK